MKIKFQYFNIRNRGLDSSGLSSDVGRSLVRKIFGRTLDGNGGIDSLDVRLRTDVEEVEGPHVGVGCSGHHNRDTSHLHHGQFHFVAGENNSRGKM